MKINKYSQFLKENNQFDYRNVDDYVTNTGRHWGIKNHLVDDKYIGKFEGENFEKIMSEHQQWLIGLREDFADLIKDCSSGSSYSDLCKKKTDPNIDVEEVQKDLDECGWNLQSILNLFSQEVDTITNQKFEDFINSYGLDNKNGIVDIYLYKLAETLGKDSNIVELGGGGWSEYAKEPEESLIRYRYGYHHTKYGQLMLQQCRLSEEKFIEMALTELRNEIIESLKNEFESPKEDFNSLIFVDDDRIIVYVNDILSLVIDRFQNDTDRDYLLSLIAKNIEGTGLSILDTGTDLILSETTE